MSSNSFTEYALQNYEYSGCFIRSEFKQDLRMVSSIKKMLTELVSGSVYDVRRIVNMFVCLGNVFDRDSVPRLLEYKLDEYYYPIANSFLLFLNFPCINSEYDSLLLDTIRIEYENI